MKYRLTFSPRQGKKMNHYLVSNSEEETERLKKIMYDKGYDLKRISLFKERKNYGRIC